MERRRRMTLLGFLFAALASVAAPPAASADESLDARIREQLASIEEQRREVRDYEQWLNDTAERILLVNPFSLPVMVPPEQLWAAFTLQERERALLDGRPFDAAVVAERMKLARDMSKAMRAELRVRLDDMRRMINAQEEQVRALMDQRESLAQEQKSGTSPEALKAAFNQEIVELLKKWDQAWCGQGGSGCGTTPLNVFNGLRYSVPWKPTQRQIDALRGRARCLDHCVMDFMGEKLDQQRTECIRQCDAQYPLPE